MKEFLKVMKALSDPNRVKILKLLQHKTLCVCELQAALEIAQPSVSKHLRILEEANLVGRKKAGQWADYFISDGGESPYAASLLGNFRHWLNDDPQIYAVVTLIPGLDRDTLCNLN